MAIPCSNTFYGSSPSFLDFYPMDDIIKCGQDPYEFKADIFDEQDFSIEGYMGLDKCEYDLPAADILNDYGNAITNRDCMWSGTNTSGFSPPVSSAMSGDNLLLHATAAAPFAAVTNSIASMSTTSNHTTSMASSSSATNGSSSGRSHHHSHSTSPNSILGSTLQPPALLMSSTQIKKEIKEEPSDDYEQQLQQHNIVRGTAARATSSMQNIPAGTSLLRKSNQPQQQQRRQQQQFNSTSNDSNNKWTTTKSCSIPIPATKSASSTGSFLKSLTAGGPPTSMLTSSVRSYRRPDTPHSLDDELPELKHDIDLRACIDESAQYIHSMTQELQDTNKDQIETSCLGGPVSLNEVNEVIMRGDESEEDDEDYDDDEEEDRHSSSCASMLEDGDSFGGNSRSSNGARHPSGGNSSMHHHQQPYHSDHSYTRSKDGGIGRLDNLETPSETDEEIDVVTINDRKLPTNPSDFDRRAIQTKVAHKFSHERLIKSANGGVRTVAPRRRCSFLQDTPVSNNSPVKSVNNSRYPSPTHTPYIKYHHHHQQQQLLDDLANDLLTVQHTPAEKGRKRMNGGTMMSTTSKKQNRSKKMCLSAQASMVSSASSTPSSASGQSSPTAGLKRHYSLDEADTIEKRNLHNDMERQRRIGLKNLFEALKKQIPSIREKERAPKVNILREAAKLCEQLTREDAALSRESEQLDKEMQRNRERIARLKAAIKLK